MDTTPSEPRVVSYPANDPDDTPVVLDDIEARVIGALVEKQVTTPDYYPLTLNALVNACNQLSSRDPVVNYDETTVTRALDRLRDKRLATVTTGGESRTLKFRHRLTERFELTRPQVAVVCLLLLRGPQTAGELRNRSGRLHEFATLIEVDETLAALAAHPSQPLVTKLARQPGAKESRFAHLLSGPVATPAPGAEPATSISPSAPAPAAADADKVARLEQEVAALRAEVAELKTQFAAFRKQFE